MVGAVNLSTPGTVRISMYSTEYSISATGPQNLLNLLFTVGSHAGVSPVTIDDSGSQSFTYLWNDDGQMSLTPQSGSITVNIGTTESGPTSDVEGTPVTYTSSIVGQTGTANYTWSVTRNGLPYNLSGVTTNAASLTFTPSDSGSYAVSLNVSDSASNTGSASQNLTVSDAPLTAVALTPPHAVVGQGLSNVTVFHFTNSTGNLDDLANYSAVVVLGDGNSVTLTNTAGSNGQIVSNSNGGFDVQLSYTYTSPLAGATFSVTVSDTAGAAQISSSGTITAVTTPTLSGLSSPTITYGTTTTTLSGTISGLPATPTGEVAIVLNGVTEEDAPINSSTGYFSDSFTTSSLQVAHGAYSVSYTYIPSGLYSSYAIGNIAGSGSLTVNPADLYVTALANSKTYGQTASDTGTVSGEVTGDGITASFSSTGDLATAPVANSPYTITATLSDPSNRLSNYTVRETDAVLTVNRADLTVTADPQVMTYDGQVFTGFTATVSGFVNNETDNVVSGVAGFTGSAVTAIDASTTPYTITPTLHTLAAANYAFTNFVNGTLTINPADLYVTALANSKTYGQTASDTGTVSGEVTGDGITASFSSTGDLATAPVANSPYTITATLSDPSNRLSNYTVHETDAVLTVNRADLTVTADAKVMTYDGQVFTGFTATVSGFVNNETDNVVSGVADFTGSAVAAIDASTTPYTITPTLHTLSAANYAFTNFVNGTLTINPADLYVTALANSKTYGQTASDSGTVSGEVTGDGITASFSSTGDLATAPVANSPYTITATLSDPSNRLSNYTVHETNAVLTVNRADLTVTADPQVMTYDGQVFTGFTATVSGFVNNETDNVVSGVAGFTGSAVTAIDASTTPYTITPTLHTLSAANYAFTNFVNGTLTINPADLYVTALANSKTYGQTASDTGTVSGEVTGDGITASFSSTGDLATAPVANSPYTITATLSDPSNRLSNYTVHETDAVLTVNRADLTVTADAKVMTYDGQVFTGFTATVSGFVNNETDNVVSGVADFTGSAVAAIDASTTPYTITPTPAYAGGGQLRLHQLRERHADDQSGGPVRHGPGQQQDLWADGQRQRDGQRRSDRRRHHGLLQQHRRPGDGAGGQQSVYHHRHPERPVQPAEQLHRPRD